MRSALLSGLLFGCALNATSAGTSCDTVPSMPEADQAEGIEMLQKKGKMVVGSQAPSCLELFKPQQLAMLEASARTPVLPLNSNKQSKEDAFNTIYKEDTWNGGSGPGSKVDTTVQTRKILSAVLGHIAKEKQAAGQSEMWMLDAPCGDMTWMPLTWKESKAARNGVALNYHGGDVSTVVLDRDQQALQTGQLIERSGGSIADESVKLSFSQIDLSTDAIGAYDLVFVKDLLGHLHTADISAVLQNVKDSGSRYLLVTTRPDITENADVAESTFFNGHPVNVQIAPFNLGEPVCSDLQLTNDSPHVLALFDMKPRA
mmetsp:Transcript_153654/g.271221  ORF Transcript_153654/g.271221 Transcript_153654/m.271221 type:complete len:316 (+) Transcript_153654:103-1050(+)